MVNKKSLAFGVLIGMAIMLVVQLTFVPFRNRMVWGTNLPPEAKILQIYNILETNSIIPFERDVLIDYMFRGMLEGVDDPYTYYFSREALKVFMERTDGSYAGIGMLVNMDAESQRLTIVNVFAGSPAEAAGLLPGDKIIKVDGEDMLGKVTDEITALVRGVPGTDVLLQILRGDDMLNMTITRQVVYVPTVAHHMLPGGIGYLRIESFDRVTIPQFSEAYIDLRNQGMRGLVIDLRNNPGGLLETVVHIGNLLLPQGIIMYYENNRGERTVFNSYNDNRIDIPLVLLVNGGSASASEVLAGAVRDHEVGTIVGQQTFGKGIVQSLFALPDGSAIKTTVSRYYSPNGISIHGEGIVPDYVVEVDRETAIASARLTLEEDIQLQKAIEVVSAKFN